MRPFPTTTHERVLQKQGYSCIAGVDEVGRGSWAGPLVAAAVILDSAISLPGLRDSKQLTPSAREELFAVITVRARTWGVGVASSALIDRIGIEEAQHRAMRQAVARLRFSPQALCVDGRAFSSEIPLFAFPHGDARVRCIAAASVLAKVWRDHLMRALQHRFPRHAFRVHKGYGTKAHEEAIRKHGMTPVHRRTFVPVRCLSKLVACRG